MLALLKKDLDILTKQYKMYIIMLVFFLCAGSVSTSDEFFSTFPMVICSWLTANLIAYDERQENGIDSPKKLYVISKYLFQFIVVALCLIICIAGLCSRYAVGSADFCNVLLTMLAASFLVPAVMLPIIFKNSAAKSILKYYAVLIIGIAMCYYFSAAFEHRYIAQIGLGLTIPAGILFLLLYVLSCKLSIKYYEKRED